MRIIKQNMELPEKDIVCPHCKFKLAYDDRDISIYQGVYYHELSIRCSVCGKRIVLKHVSEGC